MSELVVDLHKHFSKKIRLLILDTLDTSARFDLDDDAKMAIVVSGLMHELVVLSYLSGTPEADLLGSMQRHYRDVAAEREQRKQREQCG